MEIDNKFINVYIDLITSLSDEDREKERSNIIKDLLNILDSTSTDKLQELEDYRLDFYGELYP